MSEIIVHRINDELYHHGIKNQKWGVQNGPPYPLSNSQRSAAERRANSHSNYGGTDELNSSINRGGQVATAGSKIASNKSSIYGVKANKKKNKQAEKEKQTAKTMSDEELRSAINRMQLENTYSDLKAQDSKAGKDYIDKKQDLEIKSLKLQNTAQTLLIAGLLIGAITKATH